MNSPVSAFFWEIWMRGRKSAAVVVGCLVFCVVLNLVVPERLRGMGSTPDPFSPVCGFLMVLSFLVAMGMFNYTEFNPNREWHGFPYRLFVLPVRTWKLVAWPMLFALLAVEGLFFAWIALVWTRNQLQTPLWFAAVVGVSTLLYQAILWSLARFRVLRLTTLSLGGILCFGVACLPPLAKAGVFPWYTAQHLMPFVAVAGVLAYVMALISVSAQRCSGGARRNWVRLAFEKLVDALPRRTANFRSATAAQFWFEWRRSGWVLPMCTAVLVIAVVLPLTIWAQRERSYTDFILLRVLVAPVIMAFVIGKGFIKPEFWSSSLALPGFVGVKPLHPGDFVIIKMKVAAWSVAVSWTLLLVFLAAWLRFWGDPTSLRQIGYQLSVIHPTIGWLAIPIWLLVLVTITWRVLVAGLWNGLSGSRALFFGSLALQVILPVAALVAAGIWSHAIDSRLQERQAETISLFCAVAGWLLAAAVVLKMGFAAVAWKNISPRHTWQYVVIWMTLTAAFIAGGFLVPLWPDPQRLDRLLMLGALLVVPFGRLGLAAATLVKNRHQ